MYYVRAQVAQNEEMRKAEIQKLEHKVHIGQAGYH